MPWKGHSKIWNYYPINSGQYSWQEFRTDLWKKKIIESSNFNLISADLADRLWATLGVRPEMCRHLHGAISFAPGEEKSWLSALALKDRRSAISPEQAWKGGRTHSSALREGVEAAGRGEEQLLRVADSSRSQFCLWRVKFTLRLLLVSGYSESLYPRGHILTVSGSVNCLRTVHRRCLFPYLHTYNWH